MPYFLNVISVNASFEVLVRGAIWANRKKWLLIIYTLLQICIFTKRKMQIRARIIKIIFCLNFTRAFFVECTRV